MAIVLWMEKRKMPVKSKDLFIDIEKGLAKLFIPAMVIVEIGYLSEKSRIEVGVNDVIAFVDKHNAHVHVINVALIKNAFEIIDIPELHDRMIAATGRVNNCPVITNDPKIISSKFVTTIWD